MTKILQAIYDGKNKLVLSEQLNMPADTPVQIQIDFIAPPKAQVPGEKLSRGRVSWMDVALANPIEGPEDASENLDVYLKKQIRDTHE